MDCAPRHAYFQKLTASAAVQKVVGNYGLNITGSMPAGAESSYAQWDETDSSARLRGLQQ